MGRSFVRERLPNGLLVLLKEIHTAPLISHWVWYRTGSRNERPGITGISHWVEHMQFKGTTKYPAGVLDKAIARDGGYWNAFTYLDWTAFYETVPADKIHLAIDLEADRMVNSLFLSEEVESERTVILSEREGSENEPLFLLGEAVERAAFKYHPYRTDVIGETADLLKIGRDDLFQHYQRFYEPENAVLTMAGDFDAQMMLDQLCEVYAKVSSRASGSEGPIVAPVLPEGRIQEPVKVEIEGPGETVYLKVAWRAPAGRDPQFFTLAVLDSILSGPSSLNMFGDGGISNKTSLLYAPLVEDQIAVAFGGDTNATIDPYLYTLTVVMHPEHEPEEALRVIDAVIGKIVAGDIPQELLEKAIKQARALFFYGSENITNQAYWMGYAEMFADYRWFLDFVPALQRVSRDDLISYAREWLRADQRVIGVYRPYADD